MSGVLLNCPEATLGGRAGGDYYRLTLAVVASSAYAVRVAGTKGATHGAGARGGVSPGLFDYEISLSDVVAFCIFCT